MQEIDGQGLPKRFGQAIEILANCKGRVITTGVGKSGHIARKVSATLSSLGTPSHFLHPTEAAHGDLGAIGRGDVVMAFSHSGETEELKAVAAHCNWLGCPLVAVTAGVDSALSRSANVSLGYPASGEAWGEAPTTSTTLQIVVGDMLAVGIAHAKGISLQDFKRNHPGGSIGKALHNG